MGDTPRERSERFHLLGLQQLALQLRLAGHVVNNKGEKAVVIHEEFSNTETDGKDHPVVAQTGDFPGISQTPYLSLNPHIARPIDTPWQLH